MDLQNIFYLLVGVGALLIVAIYFVIDASKSVLKSETFEKKVKTKSNGNATNNTTTIVAITAFLIPSVASARTGLTNDPLIHVTESMVYGVLVIDLLLLVGLWRLKIMLDGFFNIDKTEAEIQHEEKANSFNWNKFLTDSVDISNEASVETDHEYDGIRELDNNLPPWWKYGFYLSIVVGVIYFMNYHVFHSSPLQAEEYEIEIAEAEAEVQAYLKSQKLNVDENSVTILTDAADIEAGKTMYMQYCKVCHLEQGQGSIKANLTDNAWIHGGSINSIFKTIKYGANNGMKSWEDELNPVQMQQVASFIATTLKGTNIEGKAPEGEVEKE